MATQRHIGTTGNAGSNLLPIALLALVIAATIAVLVVLAQPVRAPVPAAPAPIPAATQQAVNDDRPPHTRDLPPARGNQVLPAPTPHIPEWEVPIPARVSPDRLPQWEDLHPAP